MLLVNTSEYQKYLLSKLTSFSSLKWALNSNKLIQIFHYIPFFPFLDLTIKILSIKYLPSWFHIQEISNSFSNIFILSITNHDMTFDLSVLQYYFGVSSLCTHILNYPNIKIKQKHQWSIVILMMIHYIPCKQTLLCHVVVESNTAVLLHCINAVMTRVVFRPFTLINSFDCHGSSHVIFVIKIIQSPLSALLWCMQIHVQNGLKQREQ